MSYLLKHKKRTFSKSAQRMVETDRYYEYPNYMKALETARTLKENPMTVYVKIYKEETDVK